MTQPLPGWTPRYLGRAMEVDLDLRLYGFAAIEQATGERIDPTALWPRPLTETQDRLLRLRKEVRWP